MVGVFDCKYLGCKTGTSERGQYYFVSIVDEAGEPIRMRASGDAFAKASNGLKFGDDVRIEVELRSYGNDINVRMSGLEKIE